MLSEGRRRPFDPRRRVAHGHQRPDLANGSELRVGDLHDPPVFHHLGVTEELLGQEEGIGADVAVDEDLHPFRLAALAHALPDAILEGDHLGHRGDVQGGAGVAGVVEDVLHLEHPHPVAEVVILAGAHLDIPAVGALGGQEAHDDAAVQGRIGEGESGAVLAAPGHVLPHQERRLTEQQAGIDPLTPARPHPGQKGGQDAMESQLGGTVGGDRGNREDGGIAVLVRNRTAQGVHVDHPADRRRHHPVIGLASGQRASVVVPGDGAVDEARIDRSQRAVVEAEGGCPAGRPVLDHDVGAGDEVTGLAAAVLGRQVDDHAGLAAVPHLEAGQGAGPVAARWLDLDDIGAVIGEDHGDHRSRHALAEINDCQVLARRTHLRTP